MSIFNHESTESTPAPSPSTAELPTIEQLASYSNGDSEESTRPFGPHVAREFVEAACSLPTSNCEDGWNVSLYPNRAQLAEHLRMVDVHNRLLQRRMREVGFTDESIGVATSWIEQRFVDRANLSCNSFQESLYRTNARLSGMQERGIAGVANPAERLLTRYTRGSQNVELTRVTAPDLRLGTAIDAQAAVQAAWETLGGVASEEPMRVEIDEVELVGENTLVRFSEKTPIAELPDGTKVARRTSYVAELAGHMGIDEVRACLDDAGCMEVCPMVRQTEIAYAYNASPRFSPDAYSTGL